MCLARPRGLCGWALPSQGRSLSRLSGHNSGRKKYERGDGLVHILAGVKECFPESREELFCRACYQKRLDGLTPAFTFAGTWSESLKPLDLFPPHEIGKTSPSLWDRTAVGIKRIMHTNGL